MYGTSYALNSVLVWTQGTVNSTNHIFNNLSVPHSLFVAANGDVYVDNGQAYSRVEKWAVSTNSSSTAMIVPGGCSGLFVDIYENLYCSLTGFHRVLRKNATSDVNASSIVAGNGSYGFASDLLYGPCGIFVDIDLGLYVADSANNRIQLFRSGQLNGTTVAGMGAAGTIALNSPSGVVLDGNGYLFISDTENHRIVGSGPNGFRCVVGCTQTPGFAANQIAFPQSFSFDSSGNLYVTDPDNDRIQKFVLASNSCGESLETLSLCARVTMWLSERESIDRAFFVASVHSQVRFAHSVAELNFKAKNR